MAWVVTDQGTSSNISGGGAFLARAVSSTITAGSLVVVGVSDRSNAASGGSMTDAAGNTYTPIPGASAAFNGVNANGFGQVFYSVLTAQLNAGSNITYTKQSTGASVALAVLSAVGNSSSPLDSAVTASATGSSATPTVTSGSPLTGQELFIGVCTSQGTSTFTVDSGNSWASPPAFKSSVATTSGVAVGGGNQVNGSTSALTHAPTFFPSRPWANFIVGFQAGGSFSQAVSGTCSTSASLVRDIAKSSLAATVTTSANIAKAVARSFSATATVATSVIGTALSLMVQATRRALYRRGASFWKGRL